MSPNWQRVTRAEPCKVCGRGDWCTVSEIGSCCMRVESSVHMRNGGYLHRHAGPIQPRANPIKLPDVPTIDAPSMWSDWNRHTEPWQIQELATSLGLCYQSVLAMRPAWSSFHSAWAFPMEDGQGAIVGLRLRNNDGKKWAVTGSKQGIFVPNITPRNRAYITEGPTDTAAAVSIGLFALGRPSNICGGLQLSGACRRLGVKEVVLVADNDEPRYFDELGLRGIKGAERVAKEIGLKWVIVLLPAKDIREAVKFGLTFDAIDSQVSQMIWHHA